MSEEGGGDSGSGQQQGKGSPGGMIRTIAGIMRDKTEADVSFMARQERICWLERETGHKIKPMRTKEEAIAYYSSYIHEMIQSGPLLEILEDIKRGPYHPDRCPVFLRMFSRYVLVEKQRFSLNFSGSLPHAAASIHKFGSRDNNPHQITGNLTMSQIADLEERGNEL